MAELVPLDFDAFATDPAAAPDAAQAASPPTPAEPPASPPEKKPDYVIPKAPEIPVVKFAEEEKPKPALVPLDFDALAPAESAAAEKGSMPVEIAKGVAAGAVSTTGGMIKGAGGQRQQVMADERARQYRQKWLADNGYGDRIVEIATLPVEQQQALRAGMTAARDQATREMDLDNDFFVRAGGNIEKWSDEKFKAAKDYEDSITRKLAEGFGSIAPFIAVNFVPGVGQAAAFEAGYASTVGSQMDDAIAKGASKQQLLDGMRYAGLGGLTEQLPMEVLFERIPLPAFGKVMGAVVKVLSTAAAEGTQEGVQQAWQNIVAKYNYDPKRDPFEGVAESAAIGAVVGGAVAVPGSTRNHGEEEEEKVDTPDVAEPATEPGTPAAADAVPEVSTPGNLVTGNPPQPADVPKPAAPDYTKPVPAGPATQPGEVFTPSKPLPAAPVPADRVEMVPDTGTPADIGAALGGQPVEEEEEPEAFDIHNVLPETVTQADVATGLSEQAVRIKGMLQEQADSEKKQAALGQVTKVEPADTDIALALQGLPQVRTGETLGTNQAISPTPAATPKPAEAAITPAPQADITQSTPRSEAVSLTPEAKVAPGLVSPPAPARTALGEPAATVPVAPAPTEVAAFTPAAEAVPDATKLTETATETPVAATPAAPVVVGEPKAVEPVARPTLSLKGAVTEPGAKGKAIKAKAQAKAAAPVTEVVSKEAVAAGPEPERAPAAPAAVEEGPKKAEPTRLSRDAAESARGHPDLQRSAVRELPEFTDTLHEVAAEVVARHREENKGDSPAQIMRATEAEIVARTKERLAEAEEKAHAHRMVDEKSHAAQAKEQRVAKAEEKAKAQAAETAPQKKERRKKGEGKSGVGIRGESEKATKDAIAEDKTKPEAERDPLLKAWEHVHSLQKKLKKNPKEGEEKDKVDAERAKYMAQKAAIQELRAQKSEAAVAGREGLSKRAVEARDTVAKVLDAHPLPKATRHGDYSPGALLNHLKAFKAAIRAAGVKLADHVDTVNQSMQENLAIFSKKVLERDPTMADIKPPVLVKGKKVAAVTRYYPHDFAMAQLFMENGADGEFNTLVTGDIMEGTGYNEATGEDKAASEASRTREDTDLRERVHRPGQDISAGVSSAGWGEAEALLRSGRAEVRARDESRQAREEAAHKPHRDFTVTKPDGSKVTVHGETVKGSALLRDVNRQLSGGNQRGFIATIQNALIRHLTSLVGDIDVHFVSSEDMTKLYDEPGAGGLYYNYSPEQRAAGEKPQIFMDNELLLHPGEYVHTALHEMTHAATSLALRLNTRGTASIVKNLMNGLRSEMTQSERERFNYAFQNESEFIAEAFSNQQFQELLATLPMPPHLQRQVSGVASNRQPTWWDGVVGMVSNAIGMVWGQRGQTYMDQLVKLVPEITYSQSGQVALAREAKARTDANFQPAVPTSPTRDVEALLRNFDQILDGTKSRLRNVFGGQKRLKRDILSSSGEMMRTSETFFGGARNVLEKLITLHLRRDERRKALRKIPVVGTNSEELEKAQQELQRTQKGQYNELSSVLHESVRHKLDPSTGLNSVHNGHISKGGTRHRQKRAKHKALEARWNAMSPEAQAVGQATIAHYRKTAAFETKLIIRHAIETAMKKFGHALPAGKTIDDAVAWVRSNPSARAAANTPTADDIDFYSAIGQTAETIAKVHMLREVQGIYVPSSRRGQFFISATERPFGTFQNQRNVPAGGILDAVTPEEKEFPNRVLFVNNLAAYEAFVDSYDGQVTPGLFWVDAQGNKTLKSASYVDPSTGQLVSPKPVYVASVQNKRVEMSDNQTHLENRAKELIADGHHASSVGISKTHLQQAIQAIAPRDVNALVNNLKQTTAGNQTVSQEAIANAIYDAYIRTQTTPSHAQRGLRRSNVLGNDMDLLLNTRDYNRSFAHHVTNLEMAPQLTEAATAVDKYISAQQHLEPPDSGLTIRRQQLYEEVKNRIKGYQGDTKQTKTMRVANSVMDIAVLKHLFSPHYSIMNAMQPYMTTMPVLQGKFGIAATSIEMGRAYAIGGAGGVGGGLAETARAIKGIAKRTPRDAKDNDEWWDNQVANEADGGKLQELFKLIRELGWGASSGIEAPGIAEIEKTIVGKALGRLVTVAKALPEAIEGVNRYTTAIAAYRLAVKVGGMNHEDAMRYAALTVEQTQGGYGAANNPTFYQHPLLKAPLQFRKYSQMYGNLYYRNLMWIFRGNRQQKIEAAKTLAGLTFTTVTLAGMYGLPMVEVLRMLTNAFAAIGVLDNDWGDDEVAMQKWMAGMIQWASGSKSLGEHLAEAQMRGWTRLIDIDTSNAFGADSMFMFGEPKTMDEKGTIEWLFKAALGAPGGMAWDSGKALVNGDFAEAIPWPKVMNNFWKAYQLREYGTVSKTTGEQYAKPISMTETVGQALGFKPASSSRQWEGGSGSKSVARRETSGERHTLMGKWRAKTGAEKSRFFREEIREWNASHRNPDEKIQMSDLVRSVRSKKAQTRREKKAEMYD